MFKKNKTQPLKPNSKVLKFCFLHFMDIFNIILKFDMQYDINVKISLEWIILSPKFI